MAQENSEPTEKPQGGLRLSWSIIIAALVALALLVLPWLAYIAHFGELGVSNDQAYWAQLGDYIGGITNPALTFVTFLALLWTIRIQQSELALTRAELNRTAEATEKNERHFANEAKKRDVYRLIETLYKRINNNLNSHKTTGDHNLNYYIHTNNNTSTFEELKERYHHPGFVDIRGNIHLLSSDLHRLKNSLEAYAGLSESDIDSLFINFYKHEYQETAKFLFSLDVPNSQSLAEFYSSSINSNARKPEQ